MTEDESPSEVGIETLVAGLAAVVTLAHPAGLAVIASGAAAPGLAAGAKNIVRRWSGRSARSQETLIQWAAKTAGLTTEELRERCESDPYLEELLALVLGAASDTVSREKILAYAALIASATTPSIAKYRWESAFVSVIRDLEPIHIELLARFTLTSIELGLGIASDPAFDRVPEMLSDEQIDLGAVDLKPALPLALATLQRHGLLVHQFAAGGMLGGGFWKITPFGVEVAVLLKAIGEIVSSSRPSKSSST